MWNCNISWLTNAEDMNILVRDVLIPKIFKSTHTCENAVIPKSIPSVEHLMLHKGGFWMPSPPISPKSGFAFHWMERHGREWRDWAAWHGGTAGVWHIEVGELAKWQSGFLKNIYKHFLMSDWAKKRDMTSWHRVADGYTASLK